MPGTRETGPATIDPLCGQPSGRRQWLAAAAQPQQAFQLDSGRISALHDPVQPHFPYPATQAAHQRRGELVGHGTTKLQALKAGVEGEGLGMADPDHQVPVPVQLVQHRELDDRGQVIEHRDYDNHIEEREPPYPGW